MTVMTSLVIDPEHVGDVDSYVYNVHSILDWKLKLVVVGEQTEVGVHHPPQPLPADQLTVAPTVCDSTLKSNENYCLNKHCEVLVSFSNLQT